MTAHACPHIEPLEPRIAPASFVWDGSASGDWFTAANWTPDGIPGIADTAILSINSTISLAASTSVAVLQQSTGTLANAPGVTFTVLESLNWSGGTIRGGTLNGGAGAVLSLAPFTGGTLDGVTLGADFTVNNGSTLTVRNGLTLAGGAALTLATLGNGATVSFVGTQTLGGTGEVIFAGNNVNNVLRSQGGGSAATAAVLTLGPGILVHGPQSGTVDGFFSFDGVLNQGTISADTAGRTITLDGNPFTNQGTISAPAGTVSLGGNWSNPSGTLAVSGAGVLNFGGNFTTAGLGALTRSGGTVNLTGSLNNAGATLALTAASGSFQLVGGTITGGTVTGAGGAELVLPAFTGGTLDGVTLGADFTVNNGSTLTVRNGLTLAGGAALTLATLGNGATVSFVGTQTLGGTGEVIFAGNNVNNVLRSQGGGSAATAAVLTLGPGILVHGPQSGTVDGFFSFDGVLNQGTISADTAGRTITLDGNPFTNQGTISAPAGTVSLGGNWSNPSGTLAVSGAGVLNFGGNFTTAGLGALTRSGGTVNLTGSLNNAGATLALTAASGSFQLVGGTITGGTVTGAGGAELVLPAFTGGTLDGVTLGADFTVNNGSTLTVRNGLTLAGGAALTLATLGNGATVSFVGTQTLGGTGEVIFAGNNVNNVLRSQGGGSAATAAVLTLGPGILVHGPQSGTVDGFFSFDGVLNQGTISADTAGRTITLDGNPFTNQGTISAPAGTVSLGGNWSNPSGTLAVSGAGVLNFGGNFTTAGLGALTRSGGTVNLTGSLNNAGATLALTAASGSFQLVGGTITGGTVTGAGGAELVLPAFTGGTLDGVTLGADFTVNNGSTLTVRNGLTLAGGAALTLATLGNGATVSFVGTQTLGGTGEVIFAGNNVNNVLRSQGGGSAATAAVLTLGPGILVHGPQSGTVDGFFSFDGVLNQGTISADTAGRTITLDGNPFTNQGTISAPAGTVSLGGNWSNPSGTLAVSGAGVLNFGGNFTTAGLGALTRSGGTVNLTGSLNNAGATLALTAASGSFQLVGGTITGGTVTGAGGAELVLPAFTGGTLDGVTLGADFTVNNGSTLTVRNGLTLAGGAALTLATLGNGATVSFVGTQTLGGTGEVIFAGNNVNNVLRSQGGGSAATAAVLTLGPGILVHGPQSGTVDGFFSFDGVLNQGTISADTAGRTITLDGNPFTNQGTISAPAGTVSLGGNWSNPSGTLAVSGAGVLNFGGNFTTAGLGALTRSGGTVNLTGSLNNAGATLALTAASGSFQLVGGTITGGTVTGAGGAELVLPAFTGGTLDGVTLGADFTVNNGSTLTVRNGLTLAGGAALTLATLGNGATVSFVGTQTLGGTGEVIFAGNNVNNVLRSQGGGSAATAAVLTLGPGILVHGPQSGTVDGFFSFDGVLNQGTISADTAGRTITLDGNPFTNQGTISAPAGTVSLGGNWSNPSGTLAVSGAGVLNFGGNFTTAGLGALTRSGGTVNLTGSLNNAGATLALTAASGSFQLVGGTITGGTVTGAGGAELVLPAFTGGTLDGVTLGADFTVNNGSTLTVRNGLTLAGGAALTLATLGNGATVSFVGTQTLGGTGEVIFAGNNVNNVLRSQGGGSAATAAVLTLGPGILVHGPQSGTVDGFFSFDGVLNQGTISADTAGRTITLDGNPFTNQGTISAPAGTVSLGGNWSNPSGTLAVSGAGVLNFGGNFTTAGLGALTRSGGTVNLTGSLNNAGATLALTAASGSFQLVGGTITGGTVTGAGGAELVLPAFTGGTLDGVTLGADFTVNNGATLNVRNGLTLSGGAALTLATLGNGAVVNFVGTQTLGGTGEVVFAGTSTNNVLRSQGGGSAATAAVLTLGPGILVHGPQSGTVSGISSFDGVLNQGTISADTAGRTISLGSGFMQTAGATRLAGGSISSGGTLLTFAGGELTGVGTLTGNVSNSGAEVKPGDAATGMLRIVGNYTQTAGGVLTVQIGGATAGTQHDQLNVTGTATLDGALNAALINGFTPPGGTVFNVVVAGTLSGTFANVNGGPALSANYTSTQAQLVATGSPPGPVVNISDATVTEPAGGAPTATFTVTLSQASSQTVTVQYATTDSSAVAPGDYVAIGLTTLVFNPGEVSKTIAVTINGDTTFEPDETFQVNLSNANNATLGDAQGVGTILNDDPASTPTLSIGDVAMAEGDAGQRFASFTVSLSAASSQTITVQVATANGTAIPGADFLDVPLTTLTFAPGETARTVVVPIQGETVFEGDETFFVDLSNETNAQVGVRRGQGTILNDDPLPQIIVADQSVAEGHSSPSSATFIVTLSNPSSQPVTVQFSTADGSATSAGDYTAQGLTTLTFAPGEISKPIALELQGDGDVELNKTFFLNFGAATNATLPDATAQVTIVNDDVVIAPSRRSVTVTDVDGDRVVVSINRGTFSNDDLVFAADGTIGMINLAGDARFRGANVTIRADQAGGGDGRVDVGLLNATGLDLGTVTIDGALEQILVGDGNARKPALTSLTVASLGQTTPLAPNEEFVSTFRGAVGRITVRGDVQNAAVEVQGRLGNVSIGGDLIGAGGAAAGGIIVLGVNAGVPVGAFMAASIGTFSIKGNVDGGAVVASGNIDSVEAGADVMSGAVIAAARIKVVRILRDLTSDDPADPVIVAALGRAGSALLGIDNLIVRGDVQNAQIFLGYRRQIDGDLLPRNADARVGNVVVNGDWTASSLAAGVLDATGDGFGQNDTPIDGGRRSLASRIASIVIRGTATGSAALGDHFGITAESIGRLTIDGDRVPLGGAAKADRLLDEVNGDFRVVELRRG